MNITIVIPVYNSAKTLRPLVARLQNVLGGRDNIFEVILVNDGSGDQSWAVIQELMIEFPWVIGLDFMRNYGQHNALLAGIQLAHYEVIVTMDVDLQTPPEEIPRLLAHLATGYDVVYGAPDKKQHGLWRNLASQITKSVLQRAMGASTARRVSAFRAFRANIREAFIEYHNPYVNIDVLLTWGASRFAAVTVRHDKRMDGGSTYTWHKLTKHALNMMTGFSTLPLRIASLIGFVFVVFGVLILIYVPLNYIIHGGVVPGFTFLVSIIALFSGVQLFALGVIGEYLARMYVRSIERPPYVVRKAMKI